MPLATDTRSMNSNSPFKWHFLPDIILWGVRSFLPLSNQLSSVVRDDGERGVEVDYSTLSRWVHKYAPELDKRCRPHLLKPTNDSWRVDETYIKVKGEEKYLYRAVDSKGNTLDFLLTAKRDATAAERFFRKTLSATHTQTPRVINVDKNAAYPKAADTLKAKEVLPESIQLRQNKYLNN